MTHTEYNIRMNELQLKKYRLEETSRERYFNLKNDLLEELDAYKEALGCMDTPIDIMRAIEELIRLGADAHRKEMAIWRTLNIHRQQLEQERHDTTLMFLANIEDEEADEDDEEDVIDCYFENDRKEAADGCR